MMTIEDHRDYFMDQDIPYAFYWIRLIGVIVLLMSLLSSCTAQEEVFAVEEAVKVLEDVEQEVQHKGMPR